MRCRHSVAIGAAGMFHNKWLPQHGTITQKLERNIKSTGLNTNNVKSHSTPHMTTQINVRKHTIIRPPVVKPLVLSSKPHSTSRIAVINVSTVGWIWWERSLILWTYLPSVLRHCWLGHLTHKNPSPIWPKMCLLGRQSIKQKWANSVIISYSNANLKFKKKSNNKLY